ncbi:MAG: right-handed parallel beta-helix repeat-containing protein [Kiritimatiellae bacterium]|nr:right-handed parallel beta-helix repeat-containing protein [Kiritimatiellia bacterium]
MKKKLIISWMAALVLGTAGAARPDLVAKVAAGELKEARVSWWGFDATDATRFLQAALDSRVPRLVVDKMPSPWVALPLKGVSNQTLVFEPGAEICAKRGEYKSKGACLLTFAECQNVRLEGPGVLRMWHADYMTGAYEKSEWRHALSILSCSNVVVQGLSCIDSGGDGIYLGARGAVRKNVDIVIRDVVCRDNHRQGISVISVENLLIENTQLLTTHGTAPQAGIDFEPNHPQEVLKNCVMRNCRAAGNAGAGFATWAGQLNTASEPVDLRFENCVSVGDRTSFFYGGSGRRGGEVGGSVTLVNCRFERPVRGAAVNIRENRRVPFTVNVTNSVIVTTNAAGESVVTPMDAAWCQKHLPILSDPDGFLPRAQVPDYTRLRVQDAAPGKCLKLSPLRVRGTATYVVYAEAARTLKFRGRFCRVGHYTVEPKPFVVRTPKGKDVAKDIRLSEEDGTFSFAVPGKGFYLLEVASGRNSFRLDEADCPVALDVSSSAVDLIGSEGDFWFAVPEGTARFVFQPMGHGGERVTVRVCDPSGACVWTGRDLERVARFKQKQPKAGLWRVEVRRPSTGCFEDSSFDISGLPGTFFLSSARTWQ